MKKKLYFLSIIMIVFLSLFMMTSCDKLSGKDSEIGQSGISSDESSKTFLGRYPQTLVTDNVLISELNTLSGSKPTSSNIYNWSDYNIYNWNDYYFSSGLIRFMYYQDIDYDNNGTYDYRGVYFTSHEYGSYQDKNGYSIDTIYWFSYDPIEWDILKKENGKALIIAHLILDRQVYHLSFSTSSFSHNGGEGYANNYELSNIRKWLNDNFYNTAFNDLQKALIEITEVDNSASSTKSSSNDYACNNTNDKMFLLSYKEATTYYLSDEERTSKGSDYAKSLGLLVGSDDYTDQSYWWLRTPGNNDARDVYHVYYGGSFDYRNGNSEYVGVRPACWINLLDN